MDALHAMEKLLNHIEQHRKTELLGHTAAAMFNRLNNGEEVVFTFDELNKVREGALAMAIDETARTVSIRWVTMEGLQVLAAAEEAANAEKH